MSEESTEETPGPDGVAVPETPPDPDTADHVLSESDLEYPEFVFEDGSMAADGSFDLKADLDRETTREWLTDFAGGLASHDVAVRAPDGYAVFGVGSGDVSMSFGPDENDENHVGELQLTLTFPATLVAYSDDPDGPMAGARAGTGFIPLEMLTSDEDPSTFRCWNWIDDPTE